MTAPPNSICFSPARRVYAMARAASSDPTPSTAVITPKPTEPTCSTNFGQQRQRRAEVVAERPDEEHEHQDEHDLAACGKRNWKPSLAAANSRPCPFSTGKNSDGRIISRAMMTGMKLAAFR